MHDAPFVEQDNARRQTQCFVNVMRHQHDGLVKRLVNARNFQLQRGPRNRVQRAKGFVHQQYFRVACQRPRHPDALLLAARKLVRKALAVALGRELQQRHQFGDACVNLRFWPLEQRRHRGNVFFDAPVRKQAHRLNGVAHAAAQGFGLETANLVAGKKNAAAVMLDQPVHHLEQRRFARAGAAQNHSEFTLRNFQRQVVDDFEALKTLGDMLQFNHRAWVWLIYSRAGASINTHAPKTRRGS